ncbi:MAG: hypothetical protein KatS3mg078_0711 [Deltaproteobacteria bacterium]|nr:MAG: hypothetical protein KatS3mg078_0711 [Deltaproteobacteria bacterium]
MRFYKTGGFSVTELLIVIGVMAVVLAIAGVLSSKVYSRRSVDSVLRNVSSALQIAKLKAARHGVEYRVELNYSPEEKILSIVTSRGKSNRGSTTYQEETQQTVEVLDGFTVEFLKEEPDGVELSNIGVFDFNPNGTLGEASEIITVEIKPDSTSSVKRCGQIVVSPFGRIRIVEGNWIKSGQQQLCYPIR